MATVGDLRKAIEGVSDEVPVRANGAPVQYVGQHRENGDLLLVITSEIAPVAPVAAQDPDALDAAADAERIDLSTAEKDAQTEAERRENDPQQLTEEERKDLGLLEKLGGVEERRTDAVAQDLGDAGSEKDAL